MRLTRIEINELSAFEIRPAGSRGWVAVLVTTGKPDYEAKTFPNYEQARDTAHRWVQAENEQTVRHRRWLTEQRQEA